MAAFENIKYLEESADQKKNRFCPYCGTKLDKEAHFCKNCGEAVAENAHRQWKTEREEAFNGNLEERKIVYEGYMLKCPNCGELLHSFSVACPMCGHELRGTKGASSVSEFAQKLEETEDIEKKIDLIRNFHIANTREDIYEFFILAISNINADGRDIDAWYAKLEQSYQKARLLFGNTSEFQYLNQLYNEVKKKKTIKMFKMNIKRSKLMQILLLGAIGGFMMILGFFGGSISGDPDSPFYMIGMVGLFPLLGAMGLAISAIPGKKNK